LWAHPYWREIADQAGSFPAFVGRDEWIDGEADTHAGVRLYSDDMFSVTVRADELPNFNELVLYMWVSPTPVHAIIPNNEVRDDGYGVYFYPPLDFDEFNMTINGGESWEEEVEDENGNMITITRNPDGWRYHPRVTAGPYQFVSFDPATNIVHVEANPYFEGTWDGYIPRIQDLVWRRAIAAIQIDSLAVGDIDLIVSMGGGDTINSGLETLVFVDDPSHSFLSYPRHGYGFLNFHVDHGPTQFVEVRQAIKWLIDRDEFAFLFTAGHGTVVQGPYSLTQWFYHEGVARGLYDRIIHYSFNPEVAIEILEEGGWVLNERGEPFVLGVDTVRYKDISGMELQNDNRTIYEDEDDRPADRTIYGDLMRLEIHWMTWFAAENRITEIFEVLVPHELEAVGIALVDHRSADALAYGGRAGGRPAEFHLFNQGVTFNTLVYSPWNSVRNDRDFMASGFNSNFVNDQNLFDLARRMQFTDHNTEEGRDEFVEAWMDYIVEMNRLVLLIPLYADIFYDFIPNHLQNWHNNSIWGYSDAVLRAYIID